MEQSFIEIKTEKSSFLGSFLKKLFSLLLFVVIGAAAAWFISHEQKPTWRSSAQFEMPTVVELGNYYSLATTYALAQNGNSENLDKQLSEKAFAEFKRNLQSPDLIKLFATQSETVKLQFTAKNLPVDQAIQALITGLTFDEKQNRLNLTLNSAENAQKLLAEFIQFASVQTRSILNQELVEKWKVLFQQIKTAAETNLGAIQVGSQVAQQDWNGKLNIMKSVQPLDNKLQPFRWLKSPDLPQKPHSPDTLLWIMIGAVLGLVFGLFVVSLLSFSYRKNNE